MARAIKARSADATAHIARLHIGIGGARAVVALVRLEALPTTARGSDAERRKAAGFGAGVVVDVARSGVVLAVVVVEELEDGCVGREGRGEEGEQVILFSCKLPTGFGCLKGVRLNEI